LPATYPEVGDEWVCDLALSHALLKLLEDRRQQLQGEAGGTHTVMINRTGMHGLDERHAKARLA
jgi:hypothetical protein